MTILVTGVTGFLGSAVARCLLAEGKNVRTIARPGGDRRNLAGLPIEVIEGDYTDPACQRRAVAGITALYHVAADYRLWVPDPQTMFRTNVEGTAGLIRAAADAGAGRIVYTSSVATLGLPADGSAGDEETPVSFADMVGPYKQSKFKAEVAVRDLVAREGAPVVIVNPSTPVGPRDVKPTPTGRLILEAAAGRMPAYVDTGLNIVHVDDVARGHLLAMAQGRVGERYVLGGADMTLRAILATVAAHAGRRPPRVRLAPWMVLPIAWCAEAVARVTGREPLATVDGVRLARKLMYFRSDKAQAELGYTARPAAGAIAEAIDWFAAAGYLRR